MSRSCPYPGLRPFREEEAIYFKGREEHIKKIANTLCENKYLMITGASGDGKSSVVYAGLIPYAKAGFIKSKFNNWKLVIFKPGNSPFLNLCKALSESLELDLEYLKTELKFGFSSLIKVYKESKFYVDENSSDWKSKSIDERLAAKRSSANVLILIDQFEEFFTHSENYINNVPSDEAYLVMNLMIESAKISLAEDLPVYVTSTMRADFMGNCALYRGLPELIGQSNFFLPRLKREEIQDIVREPALLNGDAIENRLAEYLINAANEGGDQLPILQHCMNRTWNVANEMKTTMDLPQLARISGINNNELPIDIKEDILNYKKGLSSDLIACFEDAGLSNIINFHAESLLKEIVNLSIQKNSSLTEEMIIDECKYFFQSITKIDEGRPVRFLVKYDVLIKNAEFPDVIDCIIDVFGDPANSLLNADLKKVKEKNRDLYIDINHEALIRNWVRLKNWANDDGLILTNFNDLKKQTQRWEENNKDKSFLLPLGSLTFFEEFIKVSRIKSHWIRKYETNLTEAEISHLRNSISELLKDSRIEISLLALQRKKRRRVLAFSAVTVVLVLSVLSVWALSQKSFAEEQTKMAESQKELAEKSKSEALTQKEKALFAEKKANSNEKLALSEKQKAEESKNEALRAFGLAKTNENIANQQKRNALNSEHIAKVAEEAANKERDIAKTEKEKSEQMRIETDKLLKIATARSVLKKATYPFNDEQLNYLLASEAYSRLKQNEKPAKLFSQEVFEGLSYLIQNEDNAIKNLGISGSLNYFSLYNDENGSGFVSISNGEVSITDVNGKKKHSFNFDDYLKVYTIEVSGNYTLIQKTSKEISIHDEKGELIAKTSILDGFVEQFSFYNGVGFLRTDKGKVYFIDEKKNIELFTKYVRKVNYITHNKNGFVLVDNSGKLFQFTEDVLVDSISYPFSPVQASIFNDNLVWINEKGKLELQGYMFTSKSNYIEAQGLNSVVLKISMSESNFGILYGNNQVHLYTYRSEDPVILSFSKSKINDIMVIGEYLYVLNDKKKVLSYDLNLDRIYDKVKEKANRELNEEEIGKYFEGKRKVKTTF